MQTKCKRQPCHSRRLFIVIDDIAVFISHRFAVIVYERLSFAGFKVGINLFLHCLYASVFRWCAHRIFLDATLSPRLTIQKAHTICVGLYPPKHLCAGGKARSRPTGLCYAGLTRCGEQVRNVVQQHLYSARLPAVSALILWVSAMRNCVSNGVRTSRCRADIPRLSKSRRGLPPRRAPDRLAALLTAFRLSIAFCLRLAFTGGSDPACALSRT